MSGKQCSPLLPRYPRPGFDEMSKHTPDGVPAGARECADWPGYWVCPLGRVFSTATNWRSLGVRELCWHHNSHGYPFVRLTREGKRKTVIIHKLVARAFLPPRPSSQHEVRHLDGDSENNFWRNLAWGTPKENADDRRRHGRTSRGDLHSQAIKRGIAKSANSYWRHAR